MPADAFADRFEYHGDAALQGPVTAALGSVVDPEVAMSILDVGLVYRVDQAPGSLQVTMTMTSAACPAGDVIVDEVHAALERVLPAGTAIEVDLVWDPPWTPERISARGRAAMGW